MNKKISITTDNPALHGFLSSNLIDDVQVVSDSPYKGRGFELALTTDIQMVADLTATSKYAFARWLISHCTVLKGKHIININRKKIFVNDPKAFELITKEIDKK